MQVGHHQDFRIVDTINADKFGSLNLNPGASITVKVAKGGKRSLPANALSHVWYADIAKIRSEPVVDARCHCKLHYGVPILRAESPEFRELYDRAILKTLSYEEKLKAMRILPVTSLMTKDQMCMYLNHVQLGVANEDLPVRLTTPAESEYFEWLEATK